MYAYIIAELPDCSVVHMYHSETPDEGKSKILEGLKDPNSDATVVVATSALGMGVDIVNYYNVILYGAPKTIVDLIQEIGRVGRDGKDAVALLLYNSYHLRSIDDEVKEMFKTSDCRRLLTPFFSQSELIEETKNNGVHSCCDLCAVKCTCGSCSETNLEKKFPFEL